MLALTLSSLGLIISFQNCSKVAVADPSAGAVALAGTDGGSGNSPDDGSSLSNSSDSNCGNGHEGADGDGSESPACVVANRHKQYLLDQLIVNGMSQDLSPLKQHLQIQFIHDGKGLTCDAMSIKVQGEGLCTAFHGILIEQQDPKTKVIQDLFSVQPASINSSACQAGSLEQQVYSQVLDALNKADSVVFLADGQLIVKSGDVTVIFIAKHSQI
jgi:hypothetical protein